MNCLKCGSNLEDGQVFCSACLESMHNYPIKPGTPIHLPPQQPVLPAKPRRKKQKERKPEEEVRRLRSSVRMLTLILIVSLLAFTLVCILLLALLEQWDLSFPL